MRATEYFLIISAQLMFLAVFTPSFSVAVAVMAVLVGFVLHRKKNRAKDMTLVSERRWLIEFSALLVVPCLLLLVNKACGPTTHGPVVLPSQVPDCGGLLPALEIAPYLQIAIGALLVWRHRARLKRSAAVAFLATWWTIGAYLATGMLITGSWL